MRLDVFVAVKILHFWALLKINSLSHWLISVCSDYTLEMYKLASKVTREEANILEGPLATLLSPVYFTVDQYYKDVDIVLMGEDMRPYANFANQVFSS